MENCLVILYSVGGVLAALVVAAMITIFITWRPW